jgi:ABC-type transporter Mla MlaB component
LEGQYVTELRRSWTGVPKEQRVIVELADIRFVDPAGRALLVEMFQAGAQIVARDALTRAIRDDVTAIAQHKK